MVIFIFPCGQLLLATLIEIPKFQKPCTQHKHYFKQCSLEAVAENSEEKIQQETRGTENPETKEATPTREITQTDHLNRRLLDAFLTRLNSSESTEVLHANVQQLEINDDQEFENDQNFIDNDIIEEQNTNETSKST